MARGILVGISEVVGQWLVEVYRGNIKDYTVATMEVSGGYYSEIKLRTWDYQIGVF